MSGSGCLLPFIILHSTIWKNVSQNIFCEIVFSGLHTEKIYVIQKNVQENSGKQSHQVSLLQDYLETFMFWPGETAYSVYTNFFH